MKPFNNIKGLSVLYILIFIVCFYSSNAQIKVGYDSLKTNDSISIQTNSGVYYYGNFLLQTDSNVTMQLFENYDTLVLYKKRIHVIYIIQTELPVLANTTQPDTNVIERSIVEIDKTKINRPSNIVMLKQVAGGTLSLTTGALGGVLVGGLIGLVSGNSWEDPYVLGAIGAVSGGLLNSAYYIYKTGNTQAVRGKYLITLAGVTTGVIISVIFPPLLLVVPSLTGTLFYNYSRYNVYAQNNLGYLQHSLPPLAENSIASIPTIFQVKLLHYNF